MKSVPGASALPRALTVGLLILVTSVAAPSPASAAAIITCTRGTAPQISGPSSPGDHTENGYFTCNVNPMANGVTSMSQNLSAQYTGTDWPCTTFPINYNTTYQQQSAAWTAVGNLDCYGTYQPTETLILNGNFSYGSVAGCGRSSATQVKCTWTGPTYGIPRST